MAITGRKRKPTPLLKKVESSSKSDEATKKHDSSSEGDSEDLKQDLLKDINNEGDSSDSEGEHQDDDNDSILSFDMDDETDGDSVDGEEADTDDTDNISDDNTDNNSDEEEEGDSDVSGLEDESNEDEVEDSENDNNMLRIKKFEENGSLVKVASKSLKNNKQNVQDEYAEDTSDEEDIRNTVGNIPMNWYDEYKHIGYDWDAKKIIKPPKPDQLETFLKKMEDPDFWRTVKDPQTGQDVILSEADIELIKRINSQRIPDKNFDDYGPWIDWFSSEVEKMPIVNRPDSKRSFIPSKHERKQVGRLVHSIKMGWMKMKEERERIRKASKCPKFYMLWETDTEREKMRRIHDHVVAPKRDLPGHAESYNPPPEYLFNERELKEWEKLADEPHKRKLHFLPQKFNSLRQVPYYTRYIRERFLRCLDLYLCPRATRMKLQIEPEHLIPKLPSPKDLQPFPTSESLVYKGHTDIIRCISIEPKGEYIVTGSDDTTIKIWEISTARCIKTIRTDDVVRSVAWCPNPKLALILVASGNRLLLINPKVGDKMLIKKTDEVLAVGPSNTLMDNARLNAAVQWLVGESDEYEKGVRIVINHFKEVKQAVWHNRGDYFATLMPEGANRSIIIHQLSKRKSQIPFAKSKGLMQAVLFHPIKPLLFVATQRNVRIYDLSKQELVKKLLTNSKWISGMAVHPKGDNLLVSTYDKKMLWFDLDLSTKPYQTLRIHQNAVRNVAFHSRYPLFGSVSDDQSVIVSHGMVYNDLLQNPLIVPLKKLKTHEKRNDFGCFDLIWHPTQPWVFTTGADCTVRLYT